MLTDSVFRPFLPWLALILWSGVAAGERVPLDGIAAVVNNEVIARTTLDQETQLLREELSARGARLPSDSVFRRQVLEKMVARRIQLQLAERTGVRVADELLNTSLRKMAEENGKSLEQFRQMVEQQGVPFAEYREEMRREMILTRLRQRHINRKINVTDKDIDAFLANRARQGGDESEYRINHILIALPEAASPEVLREKQAKADEVVEQLNGGADFQPLAMSVSDSNQALEGGDLGWRKPAQIPTAFANAVPGMKPGEIAGPIRTPSGFHIIQLVAKRGMELPSISQIQARHILIRTDEQVSDDDARARLDLLLERLEGGEDFAKLAQAHSDDKNSAANGGDLGWISPGDLVPEFEDVLKTLQPGQRSAAFKSRYGWHVVEVLDRRKQQNSEEMRRALAAQHIRQRKAEEELQVWLRQLRAEAYVDYRL